ncbi:MAG: flagellar basal body protein [Smithella sp.]
MLQAWGIALTALTAFDKKLDVSANNVANMETNNFKKSRVELQENSNGGVKVTISRDNIPGMELDLNARTGEAQQTSNVALEEEIADQIITRYSYEANILTIKTAERMQKELLDIKT